MKQFTGIVISTKMQDTALVQITRQWKHPLYGKIVKRTKNYACHVEQGVKVEEGQTVTIQESKPISKTKRFKVIKVLE